MKYKIINLKILNFCILFLADNVLFATGYELIERDGYTEQRIDYSTSEGRKGKLGFIQKNDRAAYKYLINKYGDENAILENHFPNLLSVEIEAKNEYGIKSEISGELDSDGVFTFQIMTVNDRGQRGPINGYELFGTVMEFLGDKVKIIKGIWIDGTNLDLFQRHVEYYKAFLLKEQKKKEPSDKEMQDIYKSAAKATWTGRQAIRYGFSDVKSVDCADPESIEVCFAKPAPLN